jgi:hypothetical protein
MRLWWITSLPFLLQCSQVDPHRGPLAIFQDSGPSRLVAANDENWFCYESNPILPRFDARLNGTSEYTVCLRQNGPQETPGIDIQLRGNIQASEERLCALPARSTSTLDAKPLTSAGKTENPFIYACGLFSKSTLEISLTILPQDFNALYVLPENDLTDFLRCVRQPITQNFFQSCPNFSYGQFK